MSEFTATIDAYFEDIQQQKNLLNLLKSKKHIEIENEKFSIQDYTVDEIINFTLWAGGHDQTKLVTKWLSSFSPKLSIVECFSDESEKRLGFEDGKKKALKSVIQGFSRISKHYETGMVFQGGMRKAVTYLKENDVDVLETFQGERHIDRIFDKYDPYHDVKIFELLIEQGKIKTDLVLDESYPGALDGALAIFCMNTDLVIKTLNNGGNPNIVDHYSGDNLLHDFHFNPDNDSLKDLNTLLEFGINTNHKNLVGKQPIEKYFQGLRSTGISESADLCLVEQLKSLIKYGAEPYFTDKYGFGCLFYAKGYEHITRYLEENFVGLKVVDDPDNYNQLLLNRLNIKKDRDNGVKELPVYIRGGLHTKLSHTEFCELFLNPTFLNTKEKMLNRIVEYLDEVLNLDNRELLDLLCAVGVQFESVFTYSSYYSPFHLGVAKIGDTTNIKQYLEDKNIFEQRKTSFEVKRHWC